MSARVILPVLSVVALLSIIVVVAFVMATRTPACEHGPDGEALTVHCRMLEVPPVSTDTSVRSVRRSGGNGAGGHARVTRRAIPAAVERAVLERDMGVCYLCGGPAVPLHLDHVVPVIKGGQDTIDNLRVACEPCNLRKGDAGPGDWEHMLVSLALAHLGGSATVSDVAALTGIPSSLTVLEAHTRRVHFWKPSSRVGVTVREHVIHARRLGDRIEVMPGGRLHLSLLWGCILGDDPTDPTTTHAPGPWCPHVHA